MPSTAVRPRYPVLSIGLHWFTLLLLAAVYACMAFSDLYPKGSAGRAWLQTWHYMLGLSVLVLVVMRLVVTATRAAPPIVPGPPLWQTRLARGVQGLLYLFMFAMPMAGWLILSARGAPIPFFGFPLPALTLENRQLTGVVKELHEAGATAGYLLVGLHAAAALFHHYVIRDNTLRRMLPGRS